MAEDHNKVFIGSKDVMNYVTAVVMQFTTKSADEVRIIARGKFTSKAIDVAEVTSKRFLEGQLDYESIIVGSEELENKEKKKVRVSTIEIVLKKKVVAALI